MAKKKTEEIVDDLEAISEEGPGYDATAYLPIYNESRKAYDMLLVRIDTINKKAFVEVEKTTYDSEMRAHLDMMTRMADDAKAKTKKRRNDK